MSEKTEQPTSKRLRDAREKGDIPKSTEIVSAASVLAVVGYFIMNADEIFSTISATIEYSLENAARLPYYEAASRISSLVVGTFLAIVMPIVAAVLVSVLLALIPQTGFLVAPKAAIPKLENLHPKKWFQKVFSKKNLFEFAKNIIKVVVLTVAVYLAARSHIGAIFMLLETNVQSVWVVCGTLLRDMAMYTIVAFAILAAIDLVYTRFKYTKDHMMSPQEVKQEYKESEGDPHIKQKRKQLHQEMANQGTLANTRKAKVLIVNPTHYAVAVYFEQGKTKLPIITAKGQGDLAKRMIEVAKQENIPIMRQAPLARALYSDGFEGEYVPSDLLVQVAEILRVIAGLSGEQ